MILSNRIYRRLLYHHYWPLIGAVFFLGTLVVGAEYAEMGPESCELAEGLRGQFFRQANQPPRGPDWLTRVPTFERLILNKFSAFPWGKCVRRVGPTSFIFRKSFSSASKSTGPKSAEMLAGRPLCFRCFTLVQLGPNVVQCLHQNESICHKTLKAAERSCFDSAKVLPSDGALLFRHPPTKAWGPESACELLQGKFQLGYNLRLSSVEQKFECGLDAGSEMSTCADGNPTDEMTFRFRNCTFPNFEQHFQCLDSWPMNSNQEMGTGTGIGSSSSSGSSFIAVYNTATQEFRCGILKVVDELTTKLHLSVDSSCARLTPEGENALEEFTLRQYTPSIVQQSSSSSPTDRNSTCEFPLWLRGRQFSNGLRVGQTRILHQPAEIGSNLWAERRRASQRTRTTAAGQIASICVRQQGPERFLVQSAGKCGQSLGFHCLWFRMRSEALIEFRTTGIQSKFDELICDSTQFSPWTALLTVKMNDANGPKQLPLAGLPSVACGLQGHFTTPKQRWLSQDCFSLDADCSTPNRLKLLAFQCQSGKVFDVSEFECLSSWREGTDKKGYLLYIFARRLGHEASDAAETSGICFASRESGLRGSKGIDFVLLGNNCRRQFDWESDEVLALKKKGHCEDRLVEEDGHQLMDFMAHDAQEQEMRQDGLSSSIAHTENEVPELIANGSLTRGVVLSNDGASAAAREFVIIIIVSSIFIFYFSDYFLI